MKQLILINKNKIPRKGSTKVALFFGIPSIFLTKKCYFYVCLHLIANFNKLHLANWDRVCNFAVGKYYVLYMPYLLFTALPLYLCTKTTKFFSY